MKNDLNAELDSKTNKFRLLLIKKCKKKNSMKICIAVDYYFIINNGKQSEYSTWLKNK